MPGITDAEAKEFVHNFSNVLDSIERLPAGALADESYKFYIRQVFSAIKRIRDGNGDQSFEQNGRRNPVFLKAG